MMKDIAFKRADALQAGDLIVTRIPGHAAFVDRVSDVRFVHGGKIQVDLNHWTATTIYDEGAQVRVISPAATLPLRAP